MLSCGSLRAEDAQFRQRRGRHSGGWFRVTRLVVKRAGLRLVAFQEGSKSSLAISLLRIMQLFGKFDSHQENEFCDKNRSSGPLPRLIFCKTTPRPAKTNGAFPNITENVAQGCLADPHRATFLARMVAASDFCLHSCRCRSASRSRFPSLANSSQNNLQRDIRRR